MRRLRQSLRRDLLLAFVWQAALYIVPLATLPYLARVLQPDAFGLFSFGTGLAAYLALWVDWGFNYSGTQQVAGSKDDPQVLDSVFWNTMLAKIWICAASLWLLAGLVLCLPSGRAHGLLFLCAWLHVVGVAVSADWFLRGLGLMGRFAVGGLVGRLLPIPLTFLLVRAPDDVAVAAFLQGSGTVLAGGFSVVLTVRTGRIGRPVWTLGGSVRSLRAGLTMFLSTACVSLYTHLNVVAVFALAGPFQSGLFSGAEKLRRAAQGLLAPVGLVMHPRIASAASRDRGEALRLARHSLVAHGVATLFLAGALWAAAPWLVGLVLGPDYPEAVPVLRTMTPVVFLIGINGVLSTQMLLPLGHERDVLVSLAVPGFLNLVVMPPLAYAHGALGAAASVVVAQTLVVVLAAGFCTRRFAAADEIGLPAAPARRTAFARWSRSLPRRGGRTSD